MGVENDVTDTPDVTSTFEQDVTAPSGAGAGSSAAPEGDQAERDSVSILRDAVAATRGEQAQAASPAAEPSDAPMAGSEQDRDEQGQPAEFSDVPFHKHPRFRELVEQRNAFREDATRYRNITAFLDQSGVSSEEASSALQIAALAKADPAKAWEMLRPIAEDVLKRSGLLLPDDLKQQVAQGRITRDAALEISRLRADQGVRTQREQQEQQRREREQQDQAAVQLRTAASDWEGAVQQHPTYGPEYQALREPFMREVVYLQRTEGLPKDPAGVKAQLDKAWKNVREQRAQTVRPRPRPTMPSTGGAPASSRPANLTSLDIVRARGQV